MGLFKTVSAGGQTWAHGMRMTRQVIRIIVLISLAAGLSSLGYFLYQQPKENYKAFYYLTKAKISLDEKVEVRRDSWNKIKRYPTKTEKKKNTKTPITKENEITFYSEQLDSYKNKMIEIDKKQVIDICEKRIRFFIAEGVEASKTAGKVALAFFALSLVFFLIRGKKTGQKKHLSGFQLTAPWKLKWRLRLTCKASDIEVGGVPLVKNSESQHLLITGSTGSGKTNCLRQLLMQIRDRGERAIIVDTTGSFVSEFYREKKDFLFNPYDVRSEEWNPWCECENLDFEKLAYGFIPSHIERSDEFFSDAARAIFKASLEQRAANKNFSIEDLLQELLRSDNETLLKALTNTDAAVYLDPKGERTTASIRSTLNNFVSHLRPLKETKNPFSVRKWVLSGQKDSWLFLASDPTKRESLKVLLSVWFGSALSAVKERGFSKENEKIWLIADELYSLQKLEYLKDSLAEMRKYNGCLVLATQNLSQIDEIYGVHAARSMIDQCGTKICFRQSETAIAKRMASFFGEVHMKETQEGISYGANEIRDGVTLSSVERVRPTVSHTDFQSLKNLQAYLKLPENLPPTKIHFRYLKESHIAESYIEDPEALERKRRLLREQEKEKSSPKKEIEEPNMH
ncbi:MAG: type IV secretion system DNA-binding domain-containing protein [Chlamydiia bacterium]|nr:type IV secretion system DNA-binding domain-containing protein [Chlamydiia bacterium]